jgi:hypothetical protein
MDKQLTFIRGCVVTSTTSTDDTGYMMRDYFLYEGDPEAFFKSVQGRIDDNFFDTPNRIQKKLDYFLKNYKGD